MGLEGSPQDVWNPHPLLAAVWNQLILGSQRSRDYPENVILLVWWEEVTLSRLVSSIFLRQWMDWALYTEGEPRLSPGG